MCSAVIDCLGHQLIECMTSLANPIPSIEPISISIPDNLIESHPHPPFTLGLVASDWADVYRSFFLVGL